MQTVLPKIHYIYNFCNDLKAIREFYSECIGLQECFYEPKYGCISYQLQGLEFMFWETDEDLKKPSGFAWQPGGGGGELQVVSWTMVVSEENYPDVVSKLLKMNLKMVKGKPQWLQNSYWAFVVNDPAGNTVEVCTYPSRKPDSTEWV
ncbi:hypothetical protein IT568_09970 [bacterium]|nr:hypothetical protein [bacterium]